MVINGIHKRNLYHCMSSMLKNKQYYKEIRISLTIEMYVTTIGTKILCDFFFAQTLLSSITLGKRFRTKFTYDYNLCIIHALKIISIATHHHRL